MRGTLPSASAATSTPLPDHEMHGTPADCAMMVEAILSPSKNIDVSLGPMNVMPICRGVGVRRAVARMRGSSERGGLQRGPITERGITPQSAGPYLTAVRHL